MTGSCLGGRLQLWEQREAWQKGTGVSGDWLHGEKGLHR